MKQEPTPSASGPSSQPPPPASENLPESPHSTLFPPLPPGPPEPPPPSESLQNHEKYTQHEKHPSPNSYDKTLDNDLSKRHQWKMPNPRTLVGLMFALSGFCMAILIIAFWFFNNHQMSISNSTSSSASSNSSTSSKGEPSTNKTKKPENAASSQVRAAVIERMQKVKGQSYLTRSTLSLSPEKSYYRGVSELPTDTTPPDPGSKQQAASITNQLRVFGKYLSAEDSESISKNCWMIPPEIRQDRYMSDQARYTIFDALFNTPSVDEQGISWKSDLATVFVPWGVNTAIQQCPQIRLDHKRDVPTPEVLKYQITRLTARSVVPINPSDKETDFPLLCSEWTPSTEYNVLFPRINPITIQEDGHVNIEQKNQLNSLRDSRLSLWELKNNQEQSQRIFLGATSLDARIGILVRESANGQLCLGPLLSTSAQKILHSSQSEN